MSCTFTLKGTSHELSNSYFPPINLDSNSEYCLGLIGLQTFNTIPNIEEGNNKFYYSTTTDNENKSITIPTGSYEITDIENYLQKIVCADVASGGGVDGVERDDEERNRNNILSLKPNNNTLKCEIKSIYDIDFTPPDSIGRILGFIKKTKLKAKELHESDSPVDIIKVNSIRVECNIVSGSYYGGKPSHTLFEFTPNVEPGYAINIEPKNILYMPVKAKYIDNITIRLLDQLGNPVNFRNEPILVRLELKQFG